jgi:hypothetical protein
MVFLVRRSRVFRVLKSPVARFDSQPGSADIYIEGEVSIDRFLESAAEKN